MTIEANDNRGLRGEGVYEVCALGFAGLAASLLLVGFADYRRGQDFLQMPQVLDIPAAVVYSKSIIARGWSEIGMGSVSAFGSVITLARRLTMQGL